MNHTRLRRICAALCALCLVLALGACSPLETVTGWFTSKKWADDKPYKNVKLDKHVKLGEYKGIEAEFYTDEEYLAFYMDNIFMQYGATKGIADDPAKTAVAEGDLVFFDYEGSGPDIPEEAKEGMKGKALLVVGSDQFILEFKNAEGVVEKRGFEEQMVGQPRDKEFTVDVRFPDPYANNPDLSAKDAVFKCTVHKIGSASEEITDEGVDCLTNGEFATVAEFEALLMEDVPQQAADYNMNLASDAAFANAEFLELPAKEQEYWDTRLAESAEGQGMGPEDFAQASGYQSAAAYRDEQLKHELFFYAVAEKEGITVTEEDLQALLAEIRAGGEYSDKDDELYSQVGGKGILLRHLMRNKVSEFIYANAKGVPGA
ncbi:MAG: hypothetical protein FWC27_05245 [Firmicutes bacterium]|nr:hypothetical protein [Bacillota bacterium]